MLRLKSLVIGLVVASICCRQALSVTAVTDLPRVLSKGFMFSVFAVFVTSGVLSIIAGMVT